MNVCVCLMCVYILECIDNRLRCIGNFMHVLGCIVKFMHVLGCIFNFMHVLGCIFNFMHVLGCIVSFKLFLPIQASACVNLKFFMSLLMCCVSLVHE